MDKSVIIKKLLVLFIPVLACLPLSAQEQTDTVYMFRFVSTEDMFYIPFRDNQDELLRLSECVKQHKQQILEGKIPLYVDGYCNSLDSQTENMRIAKTRSNRVKSELIIRQGLHESSFITRNHADSGDYVTVRIAVSLHTDKSGSGIGLEQVRKRLELTYPGQYEWTQGVSDDGKEYKSILSLFNIQHYESNLCHSR